MKDSYNNLILDEIENNLERLEISMKKAVELLSSDIEVILIDILTCNLIPFYSLHDYIDFKNTITSSYIVVTDKVIKAKKVRVITPIEEYNFSSNKEVNIIRIKSNKINISINQQLN